MSSQKSWDIGRFIQTLAYFDTIPIIRDIDWLKQMILGQEQGHSEISPQPTTGVILVTGAINGIGRFIVQQLRNRNYSVRVLGKEVEQIQNLVGKEVEVFAGDLALPESLQPQLMKEVVAAVCCVDWSTQRQEKGINSTKSDPKIAAIERGIAAFTELASQHLSPLSTLMLFDFTQPSEQIKEIWGAVDDVVMGGVSESRLQLGQNFAQFTGNVSTANNGGFASIRTRNFDPPLNLARYEGIELRVKGDGQRYKFFLRGENRWDGVGYSYSFDTTKGEWQNVRIPFDQLIPVFRAKTLPDAPAFDPSQTHAMQLMLSKFEYDKALNPHFSTGNFALQIESIKAYQPQPIPQLVLISNADVLRIEQTDAEREKLLAETLLASEESVRQSGLNYTIIRPCTLTDDPALNALKVAQGSELIKGQVSREAIAQLCVQVLEHLQASHKTFSVTEESQATPISDWTAFFSQLIED